MLKEYFRCTKLNKKKNIGLSPRENITENLKSLFSPIRVIKKTTFPFFRQRLFFLNSWFFFQIYSLKIDTLSKILYSWSKKWLLLYKPVVIPVYCWHIIFFNCFFFSHYADVCIFAKVSASFDYILIKDKSIVYAVSIWNVRSIGPNNFKECQMLIFCKFWNCKEINIVYLIEADFGKARPKN